MTIFWPSGINQTQFGTYSETPDTNFAEFAPEVGPPKRRRRMSISSDTVSFTLVMNNTEYALFLNFYRNTLKDGTLPFQFNRPRTGMLESFIFTTKAPSVKFSDFNLWEVEFTLRNIPGSAVVISTENTTAAVTLNPIDQFFYTPGVTVSGGNLIGTATVTGGSVRATAGIKLNTKKYFEVLVNSATAGTGNTEVGIAAANYIMTSASTVGGSGGYEAPSIGYWTDNGVYFDTGSPIAHLTTFQSGDNIGVAVDRVNHKIWFRKNGGNWNNAVIGSQNPANNTGGYDISSLNKLGINLLYPAIGLFSSEHSTCKFASSSWTYGAPTGFSALTGFTGRATIIDDTKYNAYPGLTVLPNGHFFVTWTASAVFETAPGTLYSSVSTDGGMTWGAPQTVIASISNVWMGNTNVTALANGTLLLNYFLTVGGAPAQAYVRIGTISGDIVTWGSAIATPAGFTHSSAAGGKALQLTNGDILLPVYGDNTGDPHLTSKLIRSTDNGLTWGTPLTIGAGTGSKDFSEAEAVQLSTGNIVIAVRHEADYYGYDVATSTDNGVTFTTLAQAVVITGGSLSGRPSLSLLNNDYLLLVGRGSNQNTAWSTSTDGGVTWITPINGPGQVIGETTEVDEYNSSFVISGNLVGMASSQNRHDGLGNRLQFQWYTTN
jgi:SPRY domain/BNR repeat-like domain